MAKKKLKLEFDKNKSDIKNYKEFEKYVLGLNKNFGKILIHRLNSSENIRENIKTDITEYINSK